MDGRAATANADLALRRTNVRWKIFFLLLFMIAINYIDRASLSVAMPLIAKEFNLDATQGLILSSFFWTYALMQVPGGMLADRFKPRTVIAGATIGWGFFQAIAAASTSWVMLLLTRLGLGASEAPIYPAGGKLNAIWMTQNERARGATLLDGGAPLGAALGAIVIAWLIAAFDSWRAAFLVAGVATILCGLLAWWYIRNTPREHPSIDESEACFIEAAHAEEDAQAPASRGGGWSAYFQFRSVWLMCCGWMFFNTVFYGLLTWMPTYLFKVHGSRHRRRAAVNHAVLPALVRHGLGDPLDPGDARPRRLSRRLHEFRRQHRWHHGADHRRLHRAVHRIVLPGVNVLRRSRCRPVRLLDRDRLQPQAASLTTPPRRLPRGQFGEPAAKI